MLPVSTPLALLRECKHVVAGMWTLAGLAQVQEPGRTGGEGEAEEDWGR